jgi:asparagine synthase (glutamine-hydrolysing)
MCGILAISSRKGKAFSLERSLEAIQHRGPDDCGTFTSEMRDCFLGHVRLSIIDLSTAGHQPMEDASARFVITYNGEIYNYLHLKKELEDKYGKIDWKSTTDTEVILEGFAREGKAFLSKLNGIFSFAIFDKKKRMLNVVRDPIGIKPLYYTEQDNSVFLCSELKGILGFNLKRTIRHQSLADQLAFMYVPEPNTLYDEYFKLEPGVLHVFQEGRKIQSVQLFNRLFDPVSFVSENEMIDCFHETFSAAVRRQLASDVPVSLFLSGGIDSSAVAYEVANSGANIKDAYTISISVEDKKYDGQSDDLHCAQIMAEKLGVNLKVIEASKDFVSLLPEVIDYMEDGLADPAAINTYLICNRARKDGVKVMLSGQGADEFLGGYRRYIAEKKIRDMPRFFRETVSLLGRFFPASMPGKLNAPVRRLKRFSVAAGLDRRNRLLSLYTWNDPKRITDLFCTSDGLNVGNGLSALFMKYNDLDAASAMMLVDQKFDLMSLNLAYTDKMSMMTGVEARVPFLDFELIRIMNSIPSSVKIKGSVQKYPLKKAMLPFLPKEIVFRRKAGFTLPLRAWFRSENQMIRWFFNKKRIEEQGIFHPPALEQMCSEQFSGKRDHTNTLFSMLCLQIWLDRV